MEFDIQDKVCVITGGTRGIGRAIAERFAKEGVKVIALHSGAQAVEDFSGIETVVCNVTDASAIKETLKDIHGRYGRIDILVNNAGVTRDGLLLGMKEEDIDTVFSINLKGMLLMTQGVYSIMMRQRSGKIINLSSVVGITGNKGQANYAASKAGVIGLTKSVAQELAGRNVQVNAIAPGFIDTEMTQKLPEDVRDAYLNNIPMKRFGNPDEIAQVALFLASPMSDYMTGQVLVVDGGMIA